MKFRGREKRPNDHFACLNLCGVIKVRPTENMLTRIPNTTDRTQLTADECIARNRGYTCRANERCECHRRGQYSAEDQGGYGEHDRDCIAGLLISGHFGDPAGER